MLAESVGYLNLFKICSDYFFNTLLLDVYVGYGITVKPLYVILFSIFIVFIVNVVKDVFY